MVSFPRWDPKDPHTHTHTHARTHTHTHTHTHTKKKPIGRLQISIKQPKHHLLYGCPVCPAGPQTTDEELCELSSILTSLCRTYTVILQWIPAHCNILGNQTESMLAKEGAAKQQEDRSTRSTTFNKAKTITQARQRSKWLQCIKRYNNIRDPYHLVSTAEQVTIFTLHTGHNCLKDHLFSKFTSGQSELWHGQTGSNTTEQLLHEYVLHDIWGRQVCSFFFFFFARKKIHAAFDYESQHLHCSTI